jgi:hypothetical protein
MDREQFIAELVGNGWPEAEATAEWEAIQHEQGCRPE